MIPIDRGALADFCRRRHVRKLSLFGSVLRQDFGPASDVDVLVEFEPDHVPGFIALHGLEQELSGLLGGRRVDLVTERFLNRRIRERVLAVAEVQLCGRMMGSTSGTCSTSPTRLRPRSRTFAARSSTRTRLLP